MSVNHLDARALSAPGGAFQGLVDAVSRIVDGYAQTDLQGRELDHQTRMLEIQKGRQDKLDARQAQRDDRQQAREANQDAMHQQALDLALAEKGGDPGDVAGTIARFRQRAQADRESQEAERALKLATGQTNADAARIKAVREGNLAPQLPVAAEGAAAAEGARSRLADIALKEAQASTTNAKGLATLMGNGNGGAPGSKGPTSAVLKAVHALAEAEAVSSGAAGYNELNGKLEIKDPAAWRDILRQSYKAHGVEIPDVPTPIKPIEQIDPASLSDEEAMARGFTVYRDGLRNGQPAPVAATAASPVPATAAAAPVARPAAPSMTLGQVMAAAPWAAGLPPQVVARIAAGRGINLVPDRSDMIAPQQNAPANTAAMR